MSKDTTDGSDAKSVSDQTDPKHKLYFNSAKRSLPTNMAPNKSPVKNKVVPEESSYQSSLPNEEKKPTLGQTDEGPEYNSKNSLAGKKDSVARSVSGSSIGTRKTIPRRSSTINSKKRSMTSESGVSAMNP